MINPQQLEGMVRQVLEQIPPQFGQAPEALKTQVKSVLQSALAQMDCVTREEFDTQAAVLAKTRAKLEALEQRLALWEAEQADETPSRND
ncbi:MAG: accessory factor UbiK family protein [Thiomicrospira sp.]|jgi:BMFP domain-containing protein YqiC|nr:accessory factor UbiK family protein [Thiomicrospira sp.]